MDFKLWGALANVPPRRSALPSQPGRLAIEKTR
jgi:hypothetical protein